MTQHAYPRGQWTWKLRPVIQVWQWRLRGLTAGGNDGDGKKRAKRKVSK
jgi:hypothetical protein